MFLNSDGGAENHEEQVTQQQHYLGLVNFDEPALHATIKRDKSLLGTPLTSKMNLFLSFLFNVQSISFFKKWSGHVSHHDLSNRVLHVRAITLVDPFSFTGVSSTALETRQMAWIGALNFVKSNSRTYASFPCDANGIILGWKGRNEAHLERAVEYALIFVF